MLYHHALRFDPKKVTSSLALASRYKESDDGFALAKETKLMCGFSSLTSICGAFPLSAEFGFGPLP